MCATDLQILQGYMGFQGVPGHEFVGEVSAGPAELVGTRVVAEINFACGHCPVCTQGLGRHCPTRRVMGILSADGSFAEYVSVPVANLHLVPDGVTDEAAVFTEPLAAAFEILEPQKWRVPGLQRGNTPKKHLKNQGSCGGWQVAKPPLPQAPTPVARHRRPPPRLRRSRALPAPVSLGASPALCALLWARGRHQARPRRGPAPRDLARGAGRLLVWGAAAPGHSHEAKR